jgi:hypothetical protein
MMAVMTRARAIGTATIAQRRFIPEGPMGRPPGTRPSTGRGPDGADGSSTGKGTLRMGRPSTVK